MANINIAQAFANLSLDGDNTEEWDTASESSEDESSEDEFDEGNADIHLTQT